MNVGVIAALEVTTILLIFKIILFKFIWVRASENVALIVVVFVFIMAQFVGNKLEITELPYQLIMKVDESVILIESRVYPVTTTVPLPLRVVEFMVAVYVYSSS